MKSLQLSALPCLVSVVVLIPAGSARAAPNVLGEYTGFASGQTISTRYIEQDNLVYEGGIQVGDRAWLPLQGLVTPSGQCKFKARGEGIRVNFHGQWLEVDGGAAVMSGKLTIITAGGRSSSPLVLLRGFEPGDRPPPDIRGDYLGSFRSELTGAEGEFAARISDGTSNTVAVTLNFRVGRETRQFVAVGAVDADGNLAAVGVGADGIIAILIGIYDPGDRTSLPQLTGTVVLQNAAGKELDFNSIIAILIG